MQRSSILRQIVWGGLVLGATSAFAVTPVGEPPTFYCNANRPVGADTVEALLDTKAVDSSNRGNQPRWEYATPSYPTVSSGPDVLPDTISGWSYFTGLETASYGLSHSISLNRVGFYPNQTGAVNNTMRYFRYRFYLDASVDASKFALRFGSLAADDAIKGTYLNGKRIWTTGLANTNLGAGATSDLQWRTGLNELSFAVFDTINSATSLAVASSTHSCEVDVSLADNPTITVVQAPTYAGKVYYAAPGTVVTINVSGPGVSTNLTAIADNNLEYSVVGAPLPVGSYTVTASIPGDPTPAVKPLAVIDLPNVNLAVLPNLTTADTPVYSGTTTDAPENTTVTITVVGAGVHKTYYAQTSAEGSYTVQGEPLPLGNYTVTASIPGDPTPDSKPLLVTNVPNVNLAVLPNLTTTDTPVYSGTTTDAPENTTVTITVVGPGVNQTYSVKTDVVGNYSVSGDLLPAGNYTVTASIPGDPTPDSKPLVVTDLPNVNLASLPDIKITDNPVYTGTVSDAPANTTVTITVVGPGVSKIYSAKTDTSGKYSVQGELLPTGTYTATASIPGDPTPDSKSFKVGGVVSAEPTPVPGIGWLGSGLLSGFVVMFAMLGRRKRFQ